MDLQAQSSQEQPLQAQAKQTDIEVSPDSLGLSDLPKAVRGNLGEVLRSARTYLAEGEVSEEVRQAVLTIVNKERPQARLEAAAGLIAATDFFDMYPNTQESAQCQMVGRAVFALALADYDRSLGDMLTAWTAGVPWTTELDERLKRFCRSALFAEELKLAPLLAREMQDINKVNETAILRGILSAFFAVNDAALREGFIGQIRTFFQGLFYRPPRELTDLKACKLLPEEAAFLTELMPRPAERQERPAKDSPHPETSAFLNWAFAHLPRMQQLNELEHFLENDRVRISEDDYYEILTKLPRGIDACRREGYPLMREDMKRRDCGDWVGREMTKDRYILWLALRDLDNVTDTKRLKESLPVLYEILTKAAGYQYEPEEYRKDVKKVYYKMIEDIAGKSAKKADGG